jgi:hypothetical protein
LTGVQLASLAIARLECHVWIAYNLAKPRHGDVQVRTVIIARPLRRRAGHCIRQGAQKLTAAAHEPSVGWCLALKRALCAAPRGARAPQTCSTIPNAPQTRSVLCKYYMNGCCAYGDGCRFSHDMSDMPNQVTPQHGRMRTAGREALIAAACRMDNLPTRRPRQAAALRQHARRPHAASRRPKASAGPRLAAHGRAAETPSASPQVCKYYLAGHCAYGNKCRYDHVRPEYTRKQQQQERQQQELEQQQQRAGDGATSSGRSGCVGGGALGREARVVQRPL